MVRMRCAVCGLPGKPFEVERMKITDDHAARKSHVEWVTSLHEKPACSKECAALICRPPGMDARERKLDAAAWKHRRNLNRTKESK